MALINPPFNYTGSKLKLMPQLLPLFDRSKRRFVDLFSGGGAVWTNVVQDYEEVLINDIISDLIEVQRDLIFSTAATLAELDRIKISAEDAEGFLKLRADYNEKPTPAALFMLMQTSTNNMARWNKSFKYNQTFGKRTMSQTTLDKINTWVEHLKPNQSKLHFSAKSFDQIECGANDFVYCDPPYSNAEAGYNAYWEATDEQKLYDYVVELDRIGARFCLCGFEYHDGRTSQLLKGLEERGFIKKNITSEYNKVSRKKGPKLTSEIVLLNYEPEVV